MGILHDTGGTRERVNTMQAAVTKLLKRTERLVDQKVVFNEKGNHEALKSKLMENNRYDQKDAEHRY